VKYFVTINGRAHEVELVERLGELVATVDGKAFDASYQEVDDQGQVVLLHAGRSYALSLDGDENQVAMTLAGHFYDVRLEDERERAAHAAEGATRPTNGLVTSIMPGIVVEVLVAPGQTVEKGAPLLILSAMKMQNEIAAPVAGTVQTVHVATGQAVAAGAKLVTISVT
jgi:3-methylcrotonyl-CoA carboxylase alpha subunit